MKSKCYSCGGSAKKMQDGGPTIEDLEKKNRRNILGGLSAKLGIGTAGTGIATIIGKKIVDTIKKNNEKNKEVKGMVKNLVKKAKSTKVMQKGGPTGIVGMPKYSNDPKNPFGNILKSGGTANNKVAGPGCTGGMVKSASGKCVNERPRFKSGGANTNKKFAALAPPFNKATAADRIAGAKKNARKK